jgi:hypothetical protein
MNVPEPVRKYIYSVATAILIALVLWGVLDENSSLVLAGILQAVLVIPATEVARAKVTPIGHARSARNANHTPQSDAA